MLSVDAGGTAIPALGLGTWELEGKRCADRVAEALDLGYRLIDTAQMYGNEREVGDGMRASSVARPEIFLISKLGPDRLRRASVLEAAQESLDRLGTEFLDLLLIHWPSGEVPIEETLDALMELREQGRIRHLGVSNFPPSWLERAASRAPIACNQVEYHPLLSQERLLAMTRAHRLALIAYCPLARGRVLSERVLREIGEGHGTGPAPVALRWLIQQPGVVAIPKAGERAHLRENLQALQVALSDDEMKRIASLDRSERMIDPDWAPDWER